MNEPHSLSGNEQQWLDKLVDGELDDAQRRKLLTELDAQPDGWRRCALAFLEAQAWKATLGALAAASRQDAAPRPKRSTSWRFVPWGSVLAAAASFLIAFGLGTVWRGQAVRPALEQIADSTPAMPKSPSTAPSASPVKPLEGPQWGTMTLAVDPDSDGKPESLELPVVRGPGINEQWVHDQPTAISREFLRTLRSMGREVQHQRQYYPFELPDGSRVLVPVDEVDVRAGERRFQ